MHFQGFFLLLLYSVRLLITFPDCTFMIEDQLKATKGFIEPLCFDSGHNGKLNSSNPITKVGCFINYSGALGCEKTMSPNPLYFAFIFIKWIFSYFRKFYIERSINNLLNITNTKCVLYVPNVLRFIEH